MLNAFHSKDFRGYAIASVILSKMLKVVSLNHKFASDFIQFNYKKKVNYNDSSYKNLRPSNLPCNVRNDVRKYYNKFPNLNTTQVGKKLNLPETVGNLPLEHKWFFAYYKKYGSTYIENNSVNLEELLTPLSDHEKDDLYHLT
jgi:hypothetical protein